jgi:hypothetical protein
VLLGKWFVPVVKRDVSKEPEHKALNALSKKARTAKRKTAKRQTVFKSDGWYERTALSMAISAKL